MTIYLASRPGPGPTKVGRRCRRGQAANPGTSRALIVPLFGLAPGGVWPPLRHRSRPGALTARFHPYPGTLQCAEAVCFCATFRLTRRTDPLRKPGSYPAPCPVEPGLSSPKNSGRSPGTSGLRFQSSIGYKDRSTGLPSPATPTLDSGQTFKRQRGPRRDGCALEGFKPMR